MPTNYSDKIQEALADVLQEISRLEGIAVNLRKCLPKPSSGAPIPAEAKADKQPTKKGGYRRKESHATKIAEIIRHSKKRLKIRDVINEYPKKGWTVSSKSGYNQIYRTVKDRDDLFIYTQDGYILLKGQEHPPSQEVTP